MFTRYRLITPWRRSYTVYRWPGWLVKTNVIFFIPLVITTGAFLYPTHSLGVNPVPWNWRRAIAVRRLGMLARELEQVGAILEQ